jgi:NADPH-dependent curcumin reductase CurA
MTQMVSTTTMIQRLEGMLDTSDLNAWEQDFVTRLSELLASGQVLKLSDKQVEALDKLHAKHFA